MLLIEEVVSCEGIRVYRQSIKTDAQGAYLELQLLTPALGRRLAEILSQLADETGWRMGWSPHPRQQDLIALARSPFDDRRIGIAKGPSVLPCETVRVKLAGPIEAEEIRNVQQWFLKESGFELEIIAPMDA